MAHNEASLRVGFYVFFPGGGIGRYTHELMRAMAARANVEVEVMCTPEYEWADEEAYRSWTGLQRISDEVATLRRMRFITGQFVNPRRAIRHAVAHNLDVLHLSNINHFSFPFWRAAAAQADLKIVASAHDVKRQKSILSRLWEDRQLKAFYRFANALFVHSEYQARELESFAGVARDKIYVVPHGPYPHGPVSASRIALREKWELPADQQIALFFGQLRDEKNLDGFLRGAACADESLHLVIAGTGGGRHHGAAYYRDIASDLGLMDRTTFIARYIEDEEVGELFTAADWVALPYDTTFTSQSGVLNVAAEYDCPVLVSEAPVLRETVQVCDIGLAYEGDGPAQVARGIEAMMARIDAGHRHAFAAYRERFGWDENVNRTLAVYRKLLGANVVEE